MLNPTMQENQGKKVRIMLIMRTKTAKNGGDILRFAGKSEKNFLLYLIVPTL